MKIYKTKEYRIMTAVSGKYLTADETNLITVEEADEAKAQLWRFAPEADGSWRIINTATQKALDIIDGGDVNGAWTHQWEIVDTASQHWGVEKEGEHVRFLSVSSGKYLDVVLADQKHVQIWEKAGDNQLWTLETAEKPKKEKSEKHEIKKHEKAEITAREKGEIKAHEKGEIKAREKAEITAREKGEIKAHEKAEIKACEKGEIKKHEKAEIKVKEEGKKEKKSSKKSKNKKDKK